MTMAVSCTAHWEYACHMTMAAACVTMATACTAHCKSHDHGAAILVILFTALVEEMGQLADEQLQLLEKQAEDEIKVRTVHELPWTMRVPYDLCFYYRYLVNLNLWRLISVACLRSRPAVAPPPWK